MEWRWFVIFFIPIFWHQQTWSFNIYSLSAFNWMCFVLVSYGPIRLVGEVWEYINVTYNKRFWKLLASPRNRWVDQLSFCPLQFGSAHFFFVVTIVWTIFVPIFEYLPMSTWCICSCVPFSFEKCLKHYYPTIQLWHFQLALRSAIFFFKIPRTDWQCDINNVG